MPGYENFQVERNKAFKSADKINYNKYNDYLLQNDQFVKNLQDWGGYYRKNPHKLAEDYLGVKLHLFQIIILNAFFMCPQAVYLAARGQGKTYITALFCCIYAILYPGVKIVVASAVKGQAMKIVSEKIPEIMNTPNSCLRWEIKGEPKTSLNSVDPNVVFHNGSTITIVPANDNARSARCNVLILDEFRMIDNKIIKTVLKRFKANPRQPAFLHKPEYRGKKEYIERNREIYLSSAWYKYHWSWEKVNSVFESMMRKDSYFICALPYQLSMECGLLVEQDIIDELEEEGNANDAALWDMEMNCLFVGESDGAYFKYNDFLPNRKIKYPLLPDDKNLLPDIFKNKKKQSDEIRLLCCDFATRSGAENDASIFSIITIKPNTTVKMPYYRRNIEYIESYVGMHTNTQVVRLKYLFFNLDCDYIVIDEANCGTSIMDGLSLPTIDTDDNSIEYPPIWLAEDNINKLNAKGVISTLSDLNERPRENYSQYEESSLKVIYTIYATEALNDEIAKSFKSSLSSRRLNMVISEIDAEDMLNSNKKYISLDNILKGELLANYAQFTALINECVQLENKSDGNSKFLKLKTVGKKRKDRYSSASYGNYIVDLMERKLRQANKVDDWTQYVVGRGTEAPNYY